MMAIYKIGLVIRTGNGWTFPLYRAASDVEVGTFTDTDLSCLSVTILYYLNIRAEMMMATFVRIVFIWCQDGVIL